MKDLNGFEIVIAGIIASLFTLIGAVLTILSKRDKTAAETSKINVDSATSRSAALMVELEKLTAMYHELLETVQDLQLKVTECKQREVESMQEITKLRRKVNEMGRKLNEL